MQVYEGFHNQGQVFFWEINLLIGAIKTRAIQVGCLQAEHLLDPWDKSYFWLKIFVSNMMDDFQTTKYSTISVKMNFLKMLDQ